MHYLPLGLVYLDSLRPFVNPTLTMWVRLLVKGLLAGTRLLLQQQPIIVVALGVPACALCADVEVYTAASAAHRVANHTPI